MYIIAGLGMLMLYQQRHPDVNANAYAAFATFAAVIFVAFLGVVSSKEMIDNLTILPNTRDIWG